MGQWWTKVWDRVWDQLVLDGGENTKDAEEDETASVRDAVDEARREWQSARAHFENVTDPELVDHAIYAIEAAERKYMYLLRRAEEAGCAAPKEYQVPQV